MSLVPRKADLQISCARTAVTAQLICKSAFLVISTFVFATWIAEAVLTSTHNLCFGAKIRKIGIPLHTPVMLNKSGVLGLYISRTCFPDVTAHIMMKLSVCITVETEGDDVHEGSGRGVEEEGQRKRGPHEKEGTVIVVSICSSHFGK